MNAFMPFFQFEDRTLHCRSATYSFSPSNATHLVMQHASRGSRIKYLGYVENTTTITRILTKYVFLLLK